MPISRIFQAIPLTPDAVIVLNTEASHHLARVLRAKINDEVIVFNGEGNDYAGVITQSDKKAVTVHLKTVLIRDTESPLELYLAQGISRGEKMDYIIQKAVELGVKKIIPLLTERCTVKLDDARKAARLRHWQSIVISACEQSGRNRIPHITAPQSLEHALKTIEANYRFILSPHEGKKLSKQSIPPTARVLLLVGPEGGFSEQEMRLAMRQGFQPLNLGPRILRTETAAVAAITALQCFWGDMG